MPHQIFAHTVAIANVASPPILGTAPVPILSTHAQYLVGVNLLPRIRQLVDPADTDAFEVLFGHAMQIVDGQRLPLVTLEAATKPAKRDSDPIAAAKKILRAGTRYLYTPGSNRVAIGLLVITSLALVVRRLRTVADTGGIIALLRWLDNEIVLQEIAEALRNRELVPSAPLAVVTKRCANPAGKLALALVRLVDGNHGIWVKVKTRWVWQDGDRATVFATVPDDYMEAAAIALDAPLPIAIEDRNAATGAAPRSSRRSV